MSGDDDNQSDLETLGLLDHPITPNVNSKSNNTNNHQINTTPNDLAKRTSITQTATHQHHKIASRRYAIDDNSHKKSSTPFFVMVGFSLMTIISLMLVTIYTIKATNTPAIPPLYRHVSTFGPSFRVGDQNVDDETVKDDFFPTVWLPTVDRTNILETILSQTQTELWVPTATIHQPWRREEGDGEDIPIYSESELNQFITSDYPSLDSVFLSHITSAQSFPLTLPTSKQPVSSYVSPQYTPVNTLYIIQFYAHWCGHCRRFSSHAENLAHTFNSQPTSPVRMLRVHCAGLSDQGKQLCQALDVHGYPHMYITTSRTWLWVLNQMMPEFHQRAQLWYVRSRGSSPPPGQGIINTTDMPLRPIEPAVLNQVMTKIPSTASTAEKVIDWVNDYLKQKYHEHKLELLKDNNLESDEKINLTQTAIHGSVAHYLKYYFQHSFDLNPKTKAETDQYNIGKSPSDQIPFKSSLKGMEDQDLSKLSPLELEKVQKTLLHRAGDYELNNTQQEVIQWLRHTNGLPLDDMISYIIMPKSILSGTNYFENMKPTRYYDPRINFNIRPSLLQSLYNSAAIYLPVKYTVLTEDQLKTEMLRHVSSSSNNNNDPPLNNNNTPHSNAQIFQQGYPEYSNINDKMIYWSIALREAIPTCHRSQMLLFSQNGLSNGVDQSEGIVEKLQKVSDMVHTMRKELNKDYTPTIPNFNQINHDLIYIAPPLLGNPDHPLKDQDGNKIDYNLYISSQTCYESLYDMLDMMCLLTSKGQPPPDDELLQQMKNGTMGQPTKPIDFTEGWPMEKKCQHSFCYLRANLEKFLLPPRSVAQLYKLHTMSGKPAPLLSSYSGPLPTFYHIQRDFELCYEPWSHWDTVDWQQCKGSLSYTRGYTCGLWLNLHTLSLSLDWHISHKTQWVSKALVTDGDGQTTAPLTSRFALTLRSYFKHFFLCEECQEHILTYSNELPFILSTTGHIKLLTTLPQVAKKTASNDQKNTQNGKQAQKLQKLPLHEDESDSHEGMSEFTVTFPPSEYLVLWLWHTHNMVNQRLAQVEKQHSATDPLFPKVYFPLHHKCTTCRDESSSTCISTNNNNHNSAMVMSIPANNPLPTTTQENPKIKSALIKSITDLSDSCLWDSHWSYYATYDYLVKFYLPRD